MSNSDYPPALRNYFREHNRRALWIALGSLIGAIVAWGLVYFVSEWLRLLFLTALHGLDAPNELFVPIYFWTVAATLLVIGWISGKLKTATFKFSWAVTLLHILALPARLTFAVGKNFSARVHPSRNELAACWDLLEALHRERKIPSHAVTTLLGAAHKPQRISYLLGIVELVDTDNYGGQFYLHLRNDRARSLVRKWSQSLTLESN